MAYSHCTNVSHTGLTLPSPNTSLRYLICLSHTFIALQNFWISRKKRNHSWKDGQHIATCYLNIRVISPLLKIICHPQIFCGTLAQTKLLLTKATIRDLSTDSLLLWFHHCWNNQCSAFLLYSPYLWLPKAVSPRLQRVWNAKSK